MSTVKNVYKTKTDSKAMGPVFALIQCGLVVYTTGASCFKVFQCSLSSSFIILFNIVINSRRERGATRAFVCLFCKC